MNIYPCMHCGYLNNVYDMVDYVFVKGFFCQNKKCNKFNNIFDLEQYVAM